VRNNNNGEITLIRGGELFEGLCIDVFSSVWVFIFGMDESVSSNT
jgi:hypothetical protein